MFFEKNAKLLADFSRLSQTAGARADYVQGGGGNTSVKLSITAKRIKFPASDYLPVRIISLNPFWIFLNDMASPPLN